MVYANGVIQYRGKHWLNTGILSLSEEKESDMSQEFWLRQDHKTV